MAKNEVTIGYLQLGDLSLPLASASAVRGDVNDDVARISEQMDAIEQAEATGIVLSTASSLICLP